MKNLELYVPVLVGKSDVREVFQVFFENIYLVETNKEALSYYYEHQPPIIFFYYDEKSSNPIEIIKKIREHDNKTILVVISKGKSFSFLLEALPLHLSGYITKPFEADKVEELLRNISHDLNFLHENELLLPEGYIFDRAKEIFYNEKYVEVNLTKNEMNFIKIITSKKNHYFSSEFIEHTIWEEDSAYEDCNNRLKNLLYGLRKKLPKDSIVNSYQLGYKLAFL
jgi:DNA-binding response OmpR family regulator